MHRLQEVAAVGDWSAEEAAAWWLEPTASATVFAKRSGFDHAADLGFRTIENAQLVTPIT